MVLHVFRFGKTNHNSIRWCLLLCIQFYILFYIYATGISSFLIFWRFIHPCLLFTTLKKQSDEKGRYAHLLLTLCSVSHSNFLPPHPNLIYILAIPCYNLFTVPSTVVKIKSLFLHPELLQQMTFIHLLKQWLMITDMFSIKTIANNPIHLIKIVKWIQTFEDFPLPPSPFPFQRYFSFTIRLAALSMSSNKAKGKQMQTAV